MKTIKHLLSVFILIFAPFSLAESYIYLTNSTMETLTIDTIQTGHDNIQHGNEWEQLADTVPPLATVKFLRFNRDKGIKWGKYYYFDTTVQGQNSSVVLRQKLKGTMTFSNMWLTAENDPWYYDRDIHSIDTHFDGHDSRLAFASEIARASGDDIRYVIHNNWQAQTLDSDTNSFKVMTYNLWDLLPGIEAENTYSRLHTIAHSISGYDAIVFQEGFDLASTAYFQNHISEEYPYITKIPFKLGKLLNGGSFIASRWPVEVEDNIVYDACRSDGCLASKGANYARINKNGRIYHLFGTHTHAYTGAEDIAVRFEQLAQLKTFIDSKQIPASEPVLLAGDFNVDKNNFPQEHVDFLSVLNASEPMAIGQYPDSYAGPVNVYAEDQYTEYLDYVLYSNEHLAPAYSTNELLVPRSIDAEHWGTWDLSDHYPVSGEFVFTAQ